jgi:uncharacterized Tic20 family protein
MAEGRIQSQKNLESSTDERTWAAVAHACTLLNSITAMGGLIAAGIIWHTQKEESEWVAYHALQSLVFQALQFGMSLLLVVLWILGFAFSFITIGFGTFVVVPVLILATFLMILIWFAGLIYSLYGAYQIYIGEEFHYIWVGDWVQQNLMNR